jgi:hypothetical protein
MNKEELTKKRQELYSWNWFYQNNLTNLAVSRYHKVNKTIIDRETGESKLIKVYPNIYDYLIGKYNLGDANSDISYKEERNKTGRIFKNLIIKNIREYTDIIEIVLKEDILMYIDVYKKIYGIDLTYDDVFRQLK